MGRPPLPSPSMYEVCSSGSVKVFYTTPIEEGDKDEYEDLCLAYQIQHGWQPLLLSTANCFTRILCQGTVPVVIPKEVDVVLNETDITVFMPNTCQLVKEKGSIVSEERSKEMKEVPVFHVVNIYAADLTKFNERTEAWISDGMRVFCEGGGQRVKWMKGAEGEVFRGELKASDCEKNNK